MPLVVPGINNKDDSKTSEWSNKLVGKTLGEKTDATTFAKQDLPKEHRVLQPDSMSTMDFKPERMNIHVKDDEFGELVKQHLDLQRHI